MSTVATLPSEGAPAEDDGSAVPPARQHRWWKARTDIRFATLLMSVLASSVVALTSVFIALPTTERLNDDRVDPCIDGVAARVATLPADYDQLIAATHLMQQCMRPFFVAQATTIGAGLAAQVGLAGLLYVLHPWWLARRRRLVRLDAGDNGDVLAELAMLSRQAGLSNPPTWLLAPYAGTTAGRPSGCRVAVGWLWTWGCWCASTRIGPASARWSATNWPTCATVTWTGPT